MKRFALLRLHNGGNTVVMEHRGTKESAIAAFNSTFAPNMTPLNADGYAKVNDTVSVCIAEFHEHFAVVP
jgi:hypothetical protein